METDRDYRLAHDWCKLDYGSHRSKKDVRQVSHKTDLGYDLTTSLLIDAVTGSPLAPMQIHLKTADQMHSTAQQPLTCDTHHLEQIKPMMEEADSWTLSCRPVHVIDREADSLGQFRQWMPKGLLFLVSCDDRRVLLDEESILIPEIVTQLSEASQFEEVGQVNIQGDQVSKQVAEVPIVLHRRNSCADDCPLARSDSRRTYLGCVRPHQ